MMEEPMTLAVAMSIAADIKVGRKKYGAQYRAPHPSYKIEEAATVLLDAGNYDAPTKDELTKCNRQMAALNARHEALKQKCKGDK